MDKVRRKASAGSPGRGTRARGGMRCLTADAVRRTALLLRRLESARGGSGCGAGELSGRDADVGHPARQLSPVRDQCGTARLQAGSPQRPDRLLLGGQRHRLTHSNEEVRRPDSAGHHAAAAPASARSDEPGQLWLYPGHQLLRPLTGAAIYRLHMRSRLAITYSSCMRLPHSIFSPSSARTSLSV